MAKPRNVYDYNPSITTASKSVLAEILTILGSYRNSLVLIGGWVPYFLLEKHQKVAGFQHIGSADIDFVIDPEIIDEEKYATIAQSLLDRDYRK